MNKKSNLTCGICDFCEHLIMDENQSTCNFLKDDISENIKDKLINSCYAFKSTNINFCTKGNLDIRTLKIGDIIYEYEYNICIMSKVVKEPFEKEKNIWVWESQLDNGKIIQYSHNIEFPHYSVNLYNYKAYTTKITIF